MQARQDGGIHVAAPSAFSTVTRLRSGTISADELAVQVPVHVLQQLPDAVVGHLAMLGVGRGQQHLQVVVIAVVVDGAPVPAPGVRAASARDAAFPAPASASQCTYVTAARLAFAATPADGEQCGQRAQVIAQPEHMHAVRSCRAASARRRLRCCAGSRGGLADQRAQRRARGTPRWSSAPRHRARRSVRPAVRGSSAATSWA